MLYDQRKFNANVQAKEFRVSANDQHHQHRKEEHEHERKEKKHQEREREQHPDRLRPVVYPKWLLIIGIVLMLAVVLVWTLL